MIAVEQIHAFEKAGLGKAPFQWIGVVIKRGPIKWTDKNGIIHEIGSPGQPMGCCAYCYTGIAECHIVESSDGKRFEVGSSCVRKTGDTGLKTSVREAVREARVEREDVRIKRVQVVLQTSERVKTALRQKEHPNEYRAAKGFTALEYCEWMMINAGHSGMMRVTRMIEKIEKED